jgi:hypothetical protein
MWQPEGDDEVASALDFTEEIQSSSEMSMESWGWGDSISVSGRA